MIEAVGSYNNRGLFLKSTMELNHWFGEIFLPEDNIMEGYRDEKCQQLFKDADQLHKVLLVRKEKYQRKVYFQPQNP